MAVLKEHLTEVHLSLLAVRHLLNAGKLPQRLVFDGNVLFNTDALHKGIHGPRSHVRKGRIEFKQAVMHLWRREHGLLFQEVNHEVTVRLQFAEPPLHFTVHQGINLLLAHVTVPAYRLPVYAKYARNLRNR